MSTKSILVKDFLDFATEANNRSTIDIRDGLKPVHRRILYTLSQSPKGFLGSGKVVGEVLGSYHPHGDTSVYNAAVRLSQPFKTRYPLIDFQGNNGTVAQPKGHAAMRYTKIKLSELGELALSGIEKETVEMVENYDGSKMEPVYLPGLVPITLMNGTLGIGVGMASSIPPHNLGEIYKGVSHLIKNPDATTKDLMRFIKGPDFPTGGTIAEPEALLEVYEKGSGSVRTISDYEVVMRDGRTHIIIKEVPFMTDPEDTIIGPIIEMYEEGYEYIEDIQKQTGKGIPFQLDVTLSKDAPVFKVMERLLKETSIEASFGINLTTHVGDGKFQRTNLKGLLQEYIDRNLDRNAKIAEFDIKQAKARLHIVEALIKATANIDDVVRIIKNSGSTAEATENLMKLLDIDLVQAKAVLSMRLSQLTKLDSMKLQTEKNELLEKIVELTTFLGSKEAQLELVDSNLKNIAIKYGDPRKTKIQSQAEVGEVQDVTVFLTSDNMVYAQPTSIIKTNNRNTKGTKTEDIISTVRTKSNGLLWIAAESGMVYPVDVASLSLSDDIIKNSVDSFGVEGKAVQVLIPQNKDYLITVTDKNVVKKTSYLEYKKTHSFRACKVREDDALKMIFLLNEKDNLIMLLKNNKYVFFSVEEINSTGVNTIGTKIGSTDVISVAAADDKVLFVDADGNGKRVDLSNLSKSGRKTSGLACNEAVGVYTCGDDDFVYIYGEDGKHIRLAGTSISTSKSPTAKGVILYNGKIAKILTR